MKRSIQDEKLNVDDRHVTFNNETEIRYRTASEDSSTSTFQSKKFKFTNSGFHNYNNNKSYSNIRSDINISTKKTEKESKFDMLLNGKCSWSYKSLTADDKIKKDERSTNSSCVKSPDTSPTSFSENSAEVYDFEVLDKKNTRNKVRKKKSFGLPKVEKAGLCYESNDVKQSKKNKSRKKMSKTNKNIQNVKKSPTTTRALRNKKRVNYADSSEEFDWNLDGNNGGTTQTELIITHTNQNNITRDSEYSDDEGLVFQTRYSDKNVNILEIANTIESDSNDIFGDLEEENKTTTSPTILKLNGILKSKPSEQTSSHNQIISLGDSPQINNVLEKSESESEIAFSYSPEVGNTDTNKKFPIHEELNINIDIGEEIFEKCQKVFLEIQAKSNDLKLGKHFGELRTEITDRDSNINEANAICGNDYQSKEVSKNNLTTKNNCEKRNLNENDEIAPKNEKVTDLKNKFVNKKPVTTDTQASYTNPDFKEERLEIKIMQNCKPSDFSSETKADNKKLQIIEKDLEQKNEIKKPMSVHDFMEWQTSSEDENPNKIKKESFFDKMRSSFNWDSLDFQMECDTSLSPFNHKETRLTNVSERCSSTNNDTLITNSEPFKYYFDDSLPCSAESHTTGENYDTDSFQNQRFKKIKNISPHNDSVSKIEDKNFDLMGKKKFFFSTNKQGLFFKKEDSNHVLKYEDINESKKVKKEKKPETTQKGNKKISTFKTSKDANFRKQNVKNDTSSKSSSRGKPKTWEDLETKLLSETSNNFCETFPTSYQEIESGDNIWTEKKEFKIQKINKGFSQTRTKEIERSLCLNKFENKHLNNSQVLTVANSPNLNVINKTIQAMEKCTNRYLFPFRNEFNSNQQKYEENDDLNEYSISVHSTIIHSSRHKLSATNTFFQKAGKIDTNVKKGKNNLKNKITKNNLIGKNSKTAETKTNVQKEKKLSKFSKQSKKNSTKRTMQIMKDLSDENLSDNSQNFIYDTDKSNHSYIEDVCTLHNSTILSDETNSDKSEKNFHLKETEVESRYSFRKRKTKPTLESHCKKLKTELISLGRDLQNVSLNGIDLKHSTKADTNDEAILKNKYDLSKINLDEKLKRKDDIDSGSGSNFSFHYPDEILNLCHSSDTDSNVKRKSLKKKQNTNLNIQHSSSNLKEKINLKSGHENYANAQNSKSKDKTGVTTENDNTVKSDFNKQTKKTLTNKHDSKEKYKEYLKKLFQSKGAANDNVENNEDESMKQIQKEENVKDKELKLMMKKDDELFSISSEDSDIDGNGALSEVDLTQNSGLFFDVLHEKDN